jgi:hypothetical protein
MNCRNRIALLLCPVTLLAGCASTNVTEQIPMVSPGLARPNQIWVYDFVADPTKVPADSSISAALSPPTIPPTAEELENARQLARPLPIRFRDRGWIS